MPTVGTFHSFYWYDTTPSTVVSTPGGATFGGYPTWQSSVILSSLWGGVGAWISAQMARLRWALRLVRRVERLDEERRRVLDAVIGTLESPAYPYATSAVRQTAMTLGFNRPEAWLPYSRELKGNPKRAENTFRHLRAHSLMTDAARLQGSTLTGPQSHLLVELAYVAFNAKGIY